MVGGVPRDPRNLPKSASNKNLEKRLVDLQAQLDGANADSGNETDLKLKVSKLADRARTERELRARAEKDLAKSKE